MARYKKITPVIEQVQKTLEKLINDPRCVDTCVRTISAEKEFVDDRRITLLFLRSSRRIGSDCPYETDRVVRKAFNALKREYEGTGQIDTPVSYRTIDGRVVKQSASFICGRYGITISAVCDSMGSIVCDVMFSLQPKG